MKNPKASGHPAHMLFARTCLAPLLKSVKPYVSPEYIEKYSIKVRDLDFESGVVRDPKTHQPDPEARTFTLPFSRKKMQALLDNKKPWICWTNGEARPLSYDPSLDDWWHAYRIGMHLDVYLADHHSGDMPGIMHDLGMGYME